MALFRLNVKHKIETQYVKPIKVQQMYLYNDGNLPILILMYPKLEIRCGWGCKYKHELNYIILCQS